MAPNATNTLDSCLSPSRILSLTAPGDDYQGPVVLGSPSSLQKTGRFEPVGPAFERKLSGLYIEEDFEGASAEEEAPAGDEEAPKVDEAAGSQQGEGEEEEEEKKKKKKKKKKNKAGEEVEEKEQIECYKVLGLQRLEIKATEEHIKKAYRKLSLQYHPDKAQQNGLDPEEVNEKFKVIQEAYETLIDPLQRILFDSVVPEKYDRIPTGDEDGDFFEIYALVFERFSRWSEIKPCPLLGNSSTPMEDVDAFYDFWFEFRSWRIIKGDEEEEQDLNDAEDAYERRWMAVENERVRKKYKKEHMKTIATLRDLAFKRDPRVLAAKAAEAAQKDELKLKKLEEKKVKEAQARAEADKGKSTKQLKLEADQREKAEVARLKEEEARMAKEEAEKSCQDQQSKIQAAILARQKKAASAKKADKKGGKKKK